jgi:hypothetical protein
MSFYLRLVGLPPASFSGDLLSLRWPPPFTHTDMVMATTMVTAQTAVMEVPQ